jgi:hypothetical protein
MQSVFTPLSPPLNCVQRAQLLESHTLTEEEVTQAVVDDRAEQLREGVRLLQLGSYIANALILFSEIVRRREQIETHFTSSSLSLMCVRMKW